MSKQIKVILAFVAAGFGIILSFYRSGPLKIGVAEQDSKKKLVPIEEQAQPIHHELTSIPHEPAREPEMQAGELKQAERVKAALARFNAATAGMTAAELQAELASVKAKSDEWQHQPTPEPVVEEVVDASNQAWRKLTYDGQIVRFELPEAKP